MVEIGGQPILWHIMKHYAHYGFNEFFIALGYKGDVIKRYFLDYYALNSSMTISLKSRHGRGHGRRARGLDRPLIDTGLATNTGGRVKRLEPWLRDGTFMMTYGDGVCNVDLHDVLRFHRAHGRIATVTAVRPPARFGGLVFDGDLVSEFTEKPQIGEGWINGGFIVLEPEIFDYLDGDDDSLERERAGATGRRRANWSPIATRGSGSAWTPCARSDCWNRTGSPGTPRGAYGDGVTDFWAARRVFVTGATGIVGGWLVKDLLAAGAHVVALVRDADPQSEFYRSGDYRRTAIVQGRLEDFWTLERAINEHEIDTVFHLAAQPIVGVGASRALADLRGEYSRHL